MFKVIFHMLKFEYQMGVVSLLIWFLDDLRRVKQQFSVPNNRTKAWVGFKDPGKPKESQTTMEQVSNARHMLDCFGSWGPVFHDSSWLSLNLSSYDDHSHTVIWASEAWGSIPTVGPINPVKIYGHPWTIEHQWNMKCVKYPAALEFFSMAAEVSKTRL